MPRLLDEEVTATYAGLRAAIDHGDYLIEVDPDQRYVLVGGIRSTGLTAGMAIAEHVGELLAEAGALDRATQRTARRRRGCPTSARRSRGRTRTPNCIAADPAYGRVVCFCERVTAGEIRDALPSLIPPAGLDGLRRRTRAMNGRCQGFFCGAEVGCSSLTPMRRRFARGDRDPEGSRPMSAPTPHAP